MTDSTKKRILIARVKAALEELDNAVSTPAIKLALDDVNHRVQALNCEFATQIVDHVVDARWAAAHPELTSP